MSQLPKTPPAASEAPANSAGQNYQPAANSADEQLKRMARLVGLESEELESKPQASHLETSAQPISPTSANEQVGGQPLSEPEAAEDPNEIQTKTPLWSNPFAQAGLVGGILAIIFLIAGLFLAEIMSVGSNTSENNPIIPEESPSPTSPFSQLDEQGKGDLQTKLALERQQQAMEEAQEQLRKPPDKTPKKPKENKSVKPQPQPVPSPAPSAQPKPIESSPVVIPSPRPLIQRPISTTTRPIQRPIPNTTRPIQRPISNTTPGRQERVSPPPIIQFPQSTATPPPIPTEEPSELIDPNVRWNEVAGLGQTRSNGQNSFEETQPEDAEGESEQSPQAIAPVQNATTPENQTAIPTIVVEPRE